MQVHLDFFMDLGNDCAKTNKGKPLLFCCVLFSSKNVQYGL